MTAWAVKGLWIWSLSQTDDIYWYLQNVFDSMFFLHRSLKKDATLKSTRKRHICCEWRYEYVSQQIAGLISPP